MRYFQLNIELFIIVIIINLTKADLLGSLFTLDQEDPLKCYGCFNTTDRRCNHVSPGEHDLIKECRREATGCVTKILKTDDYTTLSRDCYYQDLGLLFTDSSCNDIDDDDDESLCHKCTELLCNTGCHLYPAYALLPLISSAIFSFLWNFI